MATNAIQKSSYWLCNLCGCTFSGWCDTEELLDHLVEDHGELFSCISLPMVHEHFKRQIVVYPVKG